MGLVIGIRNIADREPAVDELNRPRKARHARTDECDDVVGPIVRLHVDFPKIAIAIVLHELLQFSDLRLDRAPGAVLSGSPIGASARSQIFIGLPREFSRLQPTFGKQLSAPELPAIRLSPEFPACHNVGARLIDRLEPFRELPVVIQRPEP
jgi:hypothetical protein